MARTYGKLMSSIWRNDDFKKLPDATTQLLYLALISQPDLSPCGRLTVALGRWADGIAGADRRAVTNALEALEAARFIVIDWDNDELLVRSFIRHDNGLGNPRRRAAIKNAAQEIGSPALRAAIKAENPGVFDDAIDDDPVHMHSFDVGVVDNRETPGHSSNVQRTTVETPVVTAMPNPGDVRRETGAVNRESGTSLLSSHLYAPDDDDERIEKIVQTAVDIRIQANPPKSNPERYRQTVERSVRAEKLERIHELAAMCRQDTPISVIAAAAESGDTRHLGAWLHAPEPEPDIGPKLTREQRQALIDANKDHDQ